MLSLEPYIEQERRLPASGRHIVASFDERSVIVYQAFAPDIASYAVRSQRFGGDFSLTRMSWIKPGFLWMMYRSGWGTKPDQQRVLAVRLARSFFERVLSLAVPSSHSGRFASKDAWQDAVHSSEVRLQWDPDHDPTGAPVERRALQLGLRGSVLEEYATSDALLEVIDVSELVRRERPHRHPPFDRLSIPREEVFRPSDDAVAEALGLDTFTPSAESPEPVEPSRDGRFRTSREAYDWIRWDPAFDASEFVIEYDVHADELAEASLVAFDPHGDIPWHRIQRIRRGRDVVWDRRERIDRLADVRNRPR